MTDRNLFDTIDKMTTHIPTSESKLIEELEKIKKDSTYTAPELMFVRWDAAQAILFDNMPKDLTKEWQLKILSIFSGVPIGVLKAIYLGNAKAKGREV